MAFALRSTFDVGGQAILPIVAETLFVAIFILVGIAALDV